MAEMKMTKGLAVAVGGALALGLVIAAPALAAPEVPAHAAAPAKSCTMGNATSSVKHAIFI